MKILIVSPNRTAFVHRVAPIGPLYLVSVLEQRGHAVKLVDCMFLADPFKTVEAATLEFKPNLIGLAVRNIDTLLAKDVYLMPEFERYIDILRRSSPAPIVAGGPGFSLMPDEMMRAFELDYGIAGEADSALPELAACLENRKPCNAIPGLLYREGGGLKINPPQKVPDLDTIPFQAVSHIDTAAYARLRGNLAVFTRKACPFNCIYCPEAALHGNKVRLRSARRVVDELEYIVKTTGVVDFDFADTTFNVPRAHAVAVCEEIIRRNLKIRFEVELSPPDQDDETVRLLKAAGCIGVDLTAESGNDRMLDTLGRGFTADLTRKVGELYRRHKIPYTVGFLLGGPGENLQSVNDSICLAKSLPAMTSAYFTVGIRVFKNTVLAQIAEKEGVIKSTEELLKPVFYLGRDFDATCASRLLSACNRSLRLYISDLFFAPMMLKFFGTADKRNIRPIWRYGTMPRIFEWVMRQGRPMLKWDEAKRCYVVC
ncbi:MAG: radical SAM protein [Deltaproteobacteria bacterium]|nr:radical SAM protein [Deltaproteobacteria bacterium]